MVRLAKYIERRLMPASTTGNIDTVELDINSQDEIGNTALMAAAYSGDLHLVKCLLSKNQVAVNIKNHDGDTALIYAAENGYSEVVATLLNAQGIEVNAKNVSDSTALMMAARSGHIAVVNELLGASGIEVNAKNIGGNTALMFAALRGHVEVVKRLLALPGINVNIANEHGNTALIIAAIKQDVVLANMLLARQDTDVNVQNKHGETALMKAVRRSVKIVRYLLDVQELNIAAQCVHGYTALMIAVTEGDVDMVNLLIHSMSVDMLNLPNSVGRDACILAELPIMKYIIYSGKLLYGLTNDQAAARLQEMRISLKDVGRDNCCDFLAAIGDMASKLSTNRISLLAARVCGISLPESIRFFGMPLHKVLAVSSLMRVSKLTKLVCDIDCYIFIHTLMLRNCVGSLLMNLPHDLKIHMLGFLAAGDLALLSRELLESKKMTFVSNNGSSLDISPAKISRRQ